MRRCCSSVREAGAGVEWTNGSSGKPSSPAGSDSSGTRTSASSGGESKVSETSALPAAFNSSVRLPIDEMYNYQRSPRVLLACPIEFVLDMSKGETKSSINKGWRQLLLKM